MYFISESIPNISLTLPSEVSLTRRFATSSSLYHHLKRQMTRFEWFYHLKTKSQQILWRNNLRIWALKSTPPSSLCLWAEKLKETKRPIVNQQCVVYGFQCDLCDAGYVGYTCVHLHNRVKGRKQQSSAIAKHYKNMHGTMPQGLLKRFKVFKKYRNKFDCLVYEMLFIRALKPNLNVQSDSIRAKVFL